MQDALDAIEYANGSVSSTWGALRARNGHRAPFNLKYMEIGNENSQAKCAHEVILKVVNVSSSNQKTDLQLEGAKVSPTASAIVLASDKPEDENTIDQPLRVRPVTLTLKHAGAASRHTFPANSVTVLRLKLL